MFAKRINVKQIEEGTELAPKFDENGLIPVVTTDFDTGELLMHAYMNNDALVESIRTGYAVYYSRSRKELWRKGESSGMKQKICEIRIDDDQDTIWLRVDLAGAASCHVGYRSCFYRSVPVGLNTKEEVVQLEFTETTKIFDFETMYPGVENPTQI